MDDRPQKILIVDDEEDFRIVLRDHFEDAGYEVVEAGDGVEGFEVFSSEPYSIDCVITDIRMPRMSGEELIPKLRAVRSYLPIIGVTGHTDLTGRLSILDNGAYYYLDKPLPQWPVVDRLIENAIRMHQHEEAVANLRKKENEIARLLRAYVMEDTVAQAALVAAPRDRMELDIRMHYIEHQKPGGDYVEWFRRSDGQIVFYVADASGHADLMSAFMTCLSSMVLHRCHHGQTPSVDQLIVKLDQALAELRRLGALGHERYLTFFIGSIDLATGELIYTNAGHPEAFLMRSTPTGVEEIRLFSNCRPVGFLLGSAPATERVQLREGDLIFVYTDGAAEVLENDARVGSGIDELADIVQQQQAGPAATVVDAVNDRLHEAVGGSFPDDTTLLAIKIHERKS